MANSGDSAPVPGTHPVPSAEDRLRALVASAPVGIYEMSPDGSQIYNTNSCLRQLAAVSPGTIGHRAWIESHHPEDRGAVEAEWKAALEDGKEFDLEYRFLNPDG